MGFGSVVGLAVAALVAWWFWKSYAQYRRAEFIRQYQFPVGLFDKVIAKRPELQRRDLALVSRGLRQFFLAYLNSGKAFVSMPSQVADELWHEFILYTKNYEAFCRKAFGAFFHHSPAAVLTEKQKADNAGLRRVWWQCCKEENINPRNPSRLPLLFALDAKLKIAGGFFYAANCAAMRADGRSDTYCGGDFSSSSYDGGTSGFGEGTAEGGIGAGSDGGSGGGSSDGGSSDSGGGCGGGGCGGGGGD